MTAVLLFLVFNIKTDVLAGSGVVVVNAVVVVVMEVVVVDGH